MAVLHTIHIESFGLNLIGTLKLRLRGEVPFPQRLFVLQSAENVWVTRHKNVDNGSL
jgi:hypothetical protein